MTSVTLNHRKPLSPDRTRRFLAVMLAIFAACVPSADAGILSSEEQAFASMMVNASGQRRDRARMVPDARLVSVARARARDMAERDYFDHVNPDGTGPNWLIKNTGYPLPSFYTSSRSLNYVESIAGGNTSASSAWSTLIGSSAHKRHLLAESSFYQEQTTYGIGHYFSAGSRYKHYWVIITAPPAGPRGLSITSPGDRVTKDAVAVAGGSAGTDFLSAIHYRLENGGGIGEWRNAAVPPGDAGSWSGSLGGLLPGSNTVRVRAMDKDGAVMDEKARTFHYAIVKPLVVSVEGEGSVSEGFAGTTSRELGRSLSIQAKPMPGMILDHWQGLPDAPGLDPFAARQTFVMEEGLSLLAVFVPSPFVALKGGFQGLIEGGSAAIESGILKVSLTGSGVFTGSIRLGGVVVPLKGRFNSQGDASVRIPRPGAEPLLLALHVDLLSGSETVTGTLFDGQNSTGIAITRGVAPGDSHAYQGGRNTVRIAPDLAEPRSPQGHGYAVLEITSAGKARIQGATADGRPFASGALVGRAGTLSFYVPIRRGEGAILGSMQLGAEVTGSLRWMNPNRPEATRYAEAFSSEHLLCGSLYIAPAAGEPCVVLSPGSNAGDLILEGGEIQGTIQQRVSVDSLNRVAFAGPVTSDVQIKLNPRNGRVSGRYIDPEKGRQPFAGVIVQGQSGAWGYVLGASASGNAELLPTAE